jgi:RNA polymerase sigma-70 factor (ECF subfamily)
VLTRYYQELLGFCFRKTADCDTAADLAQESFARVLSMQQAGEAILNPRALLRQVAVRAKIDLDRRAATRRAEEIDALDESCAPAIPAHEQPDERYATSQAVEAYMKVIETLPPRCREAFCLHAIDELPNAEIAGRMGISLSLVKRYVKYGKDACQACRLVRGGNGGTAG